MAAANLNEKEDFCASELQIHSVEGLEKCHTIYYWEPNLPRVGHISLQIHGGPYVSFWPITEDKEALKSNKQAAETDSGKSQNKNNYLRLPFASCEGALSTSLSFNIGEEDGFLPNYLRIPKNILDTEAMTKIAAESEEGILSWCFGLSNCANYIAKILSAGLQATCPGHQFSISEISPTFTEPLDVFKAARKMVCYYQLAERHGFSEATFEMKIILQRGQEFYKYLKGPIYCEESGCYWDSLGQESNRSPQGDLQILDLSQENVVLDPELSEDKKHLLALCKEEIELVEEIEGIMPLKASLAELARWLITRNY